FEKEVEVRNVVGEPVAVALAPLREPVAAPVWRVDVPVALQRIDHELERSRDIHPAVQQHYLRRSLPRPAPHVVAQLADLQELRFILSHVKRNSTSGLRPETRSASALPDPQARVQPSVPCPVLRKRFAKRVRPMTGTLLGVAGRNPAQVLTSPGTTAGNSVRMRRRMALQRVSLMLVS